jgi:cytoskeletal protein RodZ
MRKKNLLQIAKEQQAAKLAELGERLSHARRQLDIPLEAVAERTHIQTRLLKAIEEGRLEDLPEAVYIQSFIRQYANSIGLNGVHYASEFMAPPVVNPVRSAWFKSLPVFGGQLRPSHLYLSYMVLVLASVQALSGVIHRSIAQPVVSQESLQKFKDALPVGTTPMGPNPATVTLNGPTPGNPVPGQSVRVGLTVTDQSWVRVVADGKEEFEGVLTEGTTRSWNAKKQLVVKAGNAGGIMVSFNDGKAKPLGAPGTVQEVAFPPNTQITAALLRDE